MRKGAVMSRVMRSLDLFTGYGGITLALESYCKPIAYVEIEEYAQRIIAERMADGSLPRAPILADVKNIEGEFGCCDIIIGGFPCQDISVAGNGAGLAGERSGLFYEIARITKEIQPSFVFLENVPAIRTRGLWSVAKEFSSLGYDCRWTSVSAGYVGAPHRRKRWFFLAHASSKRLEGQRQESSRVSEKLHYACDSSWWSVEPNVGRVANGTPFRVDRIKTLGNGVVPEQARLAFEYLMGTIRDAERCGSQAGLTNES